jgi:hypothetical protein
MSSDDRTGIVLAGAAVLLAVALATGAALGARPSGPRLLGSITGTIRYPAEEHPPLRVYAIAATGASHYDVAIRPDQISFAIDVPSGRYYLVAYTQEEPRLSGGWTRAVPCGLTASCADHALIPVTVGAGQTVSGIDIGDWYAPAEAFPAEPASADAANGTIRAIDFGNFTFAPAGAEPLTLHNGREEAPDGSRLVSIRYADFDRDGLEDALITIGTGTNGAGAYSEDYYVYLERGGQPSLVFHDSREKPQEARIVDGSIVLTAPHWRPDDPGCCPSATETAVYAWRDGRILRISRTLKPKK